MTDTADYVGDYFDEDTVLEELKHYGVKGMKWGIRRGKKKTGLSRFEGATVDRNNRWIARYEKGAAKGIMARSKAVRADYMRAQNERIKTGQRTADDIMQIYGGTSLAGLVISRAPKEVTAE